MIEAWMLLAAILCGLWLAYMLPSASAGEVLFVYGLLAFVALVSLSLKGITLGWLGPIIVFLALLCLILSCLTD